MLARQVKIEVQFCDDDDQVGDECVDSLRLSTAGILNRAKTNSQSDSERESVIVPSCSNHAVILGYKVSYILFTCVKKKLHNLCILDKGGSLVKEIAMFLW